MSRGRCPRGKCPGGICLGGKRPGRYMSGGKCPGGTCPGGAVCPVTMAHTVASSNMGGCVSDSWPHKTRIIPV